MAKKKDGGAARAEGRRRVQNKRTEAKYGLQGFTAQANRNLSKPIIPRAQETAMAGLGISAGSAVAAAGAAIGRRVGARLGSALGRRVGGAYLSQQMGPISQARPGVTRMPQGTRVTTRAQMAAKQKGLTTIASNQAARVSSAIESRTSAFVSRASTAASRGTGRAIQATTASSTKRKGSTKTKK